MVDDYTFDGAIAPNEGYELTVPSVLSLFDTTKEERQLFVVKLMDALDAGEVNPLKVHYQLKCIEKIIELLTDGKSELSKRYKELLLVEAAKHPGKKFPFGNSEIEVKEFGAKYDYSNCGDQELLDVMKRMADLKEWIDMRQTMLKSVPASGMQTLVGDEVVTLYPPTKTSSTGISITLK